MTDFQGLVAVNHRWRWRDWRSSRASAPRAQCARRGLGPQYGWCTRWCAGPALRRHGYPSRRRRGHVSQNNDAEWARVLEVNVTGIARVIRTALPHLRRSPHAAVVNTCSAVAFMWTSFPWPSYPRAFVGNHVGIPRVCRWACKSRQRSPAKHCVWPISRPSPECHDPTRRRRLNRP